MKRLIAAATLTLLAVPAMAQDNDHHDNRRDNNTMMMNHDDHHPGNSMMMQGRHDWHKGDRIGGDDWNRGERVSDYRSNHLRRPPHGYEWRRVDNNYVLAAVAGGLIASVILANH